MEKDKIVLRAEYPFSKNQRIREINYQNIKLTEIYDEEVGKIALLPKLLTKQTELINFG